MGGVARTLERWRLHPPPSGQLPCQWQCLPHRRAQAPRNLLVPPRLQSQPRRLLSPWNLLLPPPSLAALLSSPQPWGLPHRGLALHGLLGAPCRKDCSTQARGGSSGLMGQGLSQLDQRVGSFAQATGASFMTSPREADANAPGCEVRAGCEVRGHRGHAGSWLTGWRRSAGRRGW